MSQTSNYLAFDLGAESGRAVVGLFDGERLELSTIRRFPNGPVRVFDSLHWDVLRLFEEMKQSLSLYRRQFGPGLDGIGLDTWGVDFALIGRNGALLGNPHHYRDPRTEGMLEAAFERVPRGEIFRYTGIQFMEINTLFQLLSMKLHGDPMLEQADALLMMPDLFNYWLTGVKACEFSDATTSQLYDPRERAWARVLLERLVCRLTSCRRSLSLGPCLAISVPRWLPIRAWERRQSSRRPVTIPVQPLPPCPRRASGSPISARAPGR